MMFGGGLCEKEEKDWSEEELGFGSGREDVVKVVVVVVV